MEPSLELNPKANNLHGTPSIRFQGPWKQFGTPLELSGLPLTLSVHGHALHQQNPGTTVGHFHFGPCLSCFKI